MELQQLQMEQKADKMTIQIFLLLMLTGFLAGILSGSVGVGGGIIMVPMMVFFFGMSQLSAQGTSLAVMLPPTGIMATMMYYKQGYVNWKYAAVIALSFVIGGYIGGKVAVNIDQKTIRKVFSVFMMIVAIRLFLKK